MHELDSFRAVSTALDKSQAIVEFDMDGHILDANEIFIEEIGYPADEIIGAHHSRFVPADEIESDAYGKFWARLKAGEFQQGEFRRIGANGDEWINASYTPILNDEGKVFKVIKFATFVTKRKRQSMDFAGQIAAIGRSQAVVEFAMDGTILNANDLFLNAMGYEADEVIGRHHSMFLELEDADSDEYSAFWEKLRAGHYQTAEYKRIGKNGREVWIQASYTPILDTSGVPFKVVKYATIVTEQRLRTADFQGQIEAIGLSQAVIEFDMDGIIKSANNIFLDEMGYASEEVCGKHHRIFVDTSETDTAEYEKFWRNLRHGLFQKGEFKRLAKGGRDVWISASYTPIMDLNNVPFKVVKYATFITDEVHRRERLQKAQQELETYVAELSDAKQRIENESVNQIQLAEDLAAARDDAEAANQAKSEFLAMMSHEFRTPLNAIVGFSELMKMQQFGPIGDEHYHEYANDIHSSAIHLMSLINDLLDLSAIEAGKRDFKLEAFDPGDIVGDCISQLRNAANTKNIILNTDIGDDLPDISADKRSIFQIALNLLSNAIKYTPQDGCITITLRKDQNDVLLVVEDNGNGIPEEILNQIMEPFVRAESDSHLSSSGTGLGLTIVRNLVENHHGEFSLESEIGKGTTALVRLPANILQLVNNKGVSA